MTTEINDKARESLRDIGMIVEKLLRNTGSTIAMLQLNLETALVQQGLECLCDSVGSPLDNAFGEMEHYLDKAIEIARRIKGGDL